MNDLTLVLSDKKIKKMHFENIFLTPYPTYSTNWNGLNNFDRGPPMDHS